MKSIIICIHKNNQFLITFIGKTSMFSLFFFLVLAFQFFLKQKLTGEISLDVVKIKMYSFIRCLPGNCDKYTEIDRIVLDTFPIHASCPNRQSPMDPYSLATATALAKKTLTWTQMLHENACSRFSHRIPVPISQFYLWLLSKRLNDSH